MRPFQAHNEINGIPSHMSKWLMTDILRNEWEFQGFYVSDWLDIERINTLHHTIALIVLLINSFPRF